MSVDVKGNYYKPHLESPGLWPRTANSHQTAREVPSRSVSANNDLLRDEEYINKKVSEAVSERDDMWRRREKLQIDAVQSRSLQMLNGLHAEVEKLQNINRDLERRLYVKSDLLKTELDRVKSELSAETKTCTSLRRDLCLQTRRNGCLAQTLEKTAQLYKDQISQHEERIRQLSDELRDLNQRNAHLSIQIRNNRLKEAVAQAHQRRRSLRDSILNSPRKSDTSPSSSFSFRRDTVTAPSEGGPKSEGLHKILNEMGVLNRRTGHHHVGHFSLDYGGDNNIERQSKQPPQRSFSSITSPRGGAGSICGSKSLLPIRAPSFNSPDRQTSK